MYSFIRLFIPPKSVKLKVPENSKLPGDKVNSHKTPKLMARGREKMIRQIADISVATAAAGFGVSLRTARK